MLCDMIQRQKHIDFLQRLTIQDYPNMKQKDRQKLHREVSREAYPEDHVKKDVDGNVIE